MVLIYSRLDTTAMVGFVLISTLLLIAVLAPLFGADSRIDEVARRRRLGR